MEDRDSVTAQSHLELEERVRARAEEIRRQRNDGTVDISLADWKQAEEDVLGRDPHGSAQDRGSVVGDAHAPDMSRIEELGEA